MLFNSLEFIFFLPLVFVLYWFLFNRNIQYQNFLIVVASYIFYGWWDWRFLFLIAFSTVVDFVIANLLENQVEKVRRKFLLGLSIFINLGLLGIFKYYNFFLDSFYDLIPGLKAVLGFNTLDIILPVGISFYTFQTLSYTIDVYRRQLKPTKDLISFTAFVTFFPQLVAGPIERASNLLPQFLARRKFEYEKTVDGLRQILWGLFKKVVIADNCATFANVIFNSPEEFGGSTLFLGAIFFAFQIYGDFSGYSDMAIGIARLFGFDLMQNFNFPYFSRNIGEFWRRWHISLSTWFRDYLYIPLGGSRGGIWLKIRNTFIIFIVSGFWHGANWTFLIWGFLHALFFLPLLIRGKNRKYVGVIQNKLNPSFRESVQILITFCLTTFAWIFFRAQDLEHALIYLKGIFSWSLFSLPDFDTLNGEKIVIILVSLFILIEWVGKNKDYAIQSLGLKPAYVRYSLYYILIAAIFWFGGKEQQTLSQKVCNFKIKGFDFYLKLNPFFI